MKRTRKVLAFAAAAIMSLGSLAGCATDSGGASPAPGGSAGGAAGDQVRIGVTLLTQTHPFYVAIKEAMEAKAEEAGVELLVTIADQDLNRQVSQVEDFVNQNVDAVIIAPVDSDGITGAIKKAQSANVPVVTVDIAATNAEVDSHVATDNYSGGLIAAEALAQFIDETGEVGVITYPEVQSVRDRIDGFKKRIAEYPDITIVKETPGRDREEARSASEDMLTSNPDLAGIFGFGDDMALAATQAVGDAGSSATVVGFDGMEEALAAVADENNAFRAVVVQYPDQMGATALENAVKLARGESVDKITPILPGLNVQGVGEVPVTVDGDTVTLNLES
ncbi:MAG: substrate-binding domain-containing protein [Propioniciclava sp.]